MFQPDSEKESDIEDEPGARTLTFHWKLEHQPVASQLFAFIHLRIQM